MIGLECDNQECPDTIMWTATSKKKGQIAVINEHCVLGSRRYCTYLYRLHLSLQMLVDRKYI